MKILVPLNLNGNKLTNVSLDTNDNNSVSTVEYVNLKTKISNTLKYDYKEFFDVLIDFTNASTYKLTQGSSGVVINNLGGKMQINDKILDLQNISIDRLNCKFSSEASSSNQYLKLITDDQITNQSSFTLAPVVKLGDIKQSEINNLYLEINTRGNTYQFLALMISLGKFFQICARGAGSRIVVPSSVNEKKILLWIATSGTTFKMSISNYSAQSVGSY